MIYHGWFSCARYSNYMYHQMNIQHWNDSSDGCNTIQSIHSSLVWAVNWMNYSVTKLGNARVLKAHQAERVPRVPYCVNPTSSQSQQLDLFPPLSHVRILIWADLCPHFSLIHSLFTLRKTGPPLRIDGQRGFLGVNKLKGKALYSCLFYEDPLMSWYGGQILHPFWKQVVSILIWLSGQTCVTDHLYIWNHTTTMNMSICSHAHCLFMLKKSISYHTCFDELFKFSLIFSAIWIHPS